MIVLILFDETVGGLLSFSVCAYGFFLGPIWYFYMNQFFLLKTQNQRSIKTLIKIDLTIIKIKADFYQTFIIRGICLFFCKLAPIHQLIMGKWFQDMFSSILSWQDFFYFHKSKATL